MSASARPSVDVSTSLDAEEWRELYVDALRLSGFWARTAGLAAAVIAAAAVAVVLRQPAARTVALAGLALAALAAWTAGYVWAGPRLRFPRVEAELRSAHWRVEPDRIATERSGAPVTLEWTDVDRLVVTRRLLVVQLGDGRTYGLPRRTATPVGEALIARWAEDSGADVVRRTSS